MLDPTTVACHLSAPRLQPVEASGELNRPPSANGLEVEVILRKLSGDHADDHSAGAGVDARVDITSVDPLSRACHSLQPCLTHPEVGESLSGVLVLTIIWRQIQNGSTL